MAETDAMQVSADALELQVVGQMYRLLSECLSKPTAELGGKIKSGALSRAFESAFPDAGHDAVAQAIGGIDATQGEIEGKTDDQARLYLEVDYAQMFVGPGHLTAPQYESIYLGHPFDAPESGGKELSPDPSNSVDGRYVLAIADIYRSAGYVVSPDYKDLADRLSVELEFMSHLYLKQAGAASRHEADRAAGIARDFVRDHLVRWVPLCAQRVADNARTPFYPAVLQLVCVLVESDARGR